MAVECRDDGIVDIYSLYQNGTVETNKLIALDSACSSTYQSVLLSLKVFHDGVAKTNTVTINGHSHDHPFHVRR